MKKEAKKVFSPKKLTGEAAELQEKANVLVEEFSKANCSLADLRRVRITMMKQIMANFRTQEGPAQKERLEKLIAKAQAKLKKIA